MLMQLNNNGYPATNSSSIRVMFLSATEAHRLMFKNIISELQSMTDLHVVHSIIDTDELHIPAPSIKVSFKKKIQRVQNIIEQFQPSILVVANDQGIHSLFVKLCHLKGIPTLAVQEGILAEPNATGVSALLRRRNYLIWRVLSSFLEVKFISQAFIYMGRQWAIPDWGLSGVSKIAVMGDYYRFMLACRGIPENKMVVTGYPLLDTVNREASKHQTAFLDKMGFTDTSRPIVLLITQPFVEDGIWTPAIRQSFLESIFKSVSQVQGYLIIKLHPRENLEVCKKLVQELQGVDFFITKDADLHALLPLSDAVLTVSSTVGLWALSYGKPLFVMTGFPCPTKNVLEDLAIPVNNVQGLPDMFNSILKNEKAENDLTNIAKKNIFNHLYRLDGKASQRVAQLILSMFNQPFCRQ